MSIIYLIKVKKGTKGKKVTLKNKNKISLNFYKVR